MQSLKKTQIKLLERVGLCLFSLFLCSALQAHPHKKRVIKKATSSWQLPYPCIPFMNKYNRLYLGMGILDRGHTVSFSVVEKNCAYGYVHKVRDFREEYYVSDSAHYSLKLNTSKKYSVFVGGSLGYEQHDRSEYFAKNYITIRPRISLWKRYTEHFAVGADMELGKMYWVTQKQHGVSARMRGYEPKPEISIGINLKLN